MSLTSYFPGLLAKFLLVLVCVLVGPLCYAQKRSTRNKAPAPPKEVSTPVTPIETANQKNFKNAQAVMSRLLKTLGDERLPAPKLTMAAEGSRGVWVDFDQMEIGIEANAYQAAQALMGDTALAFLLSVPVMYYYDTGSSGKTALRKADLLKTGFGADSLSYYRSGFLTFSAGYGLFDKGPELMAQLHKAYNLPDDAALNAQRELLQRAAQRLDRMIELFDMANLMAAVNRFEDAQAYYLFLLKDYQSKQMWNNAGVSAVLNALDYFRPTEPERRFRFPLEMDMESVGGRDVQDKFKDIRNRLLNEALGHFDAALALDSTYAPAALNKACALALLGEVQKAEAQADTAARHAAANPAYRKTASDVGVLYGILHAWKDEADKAARLFEAGVEAQSAVAQYNLDVIQNREPQAPAKAFFSLPEDIDGRTLADQNNLPGFSRGSEIAVSDAIRFYHNRNPGPNSRFYVSRNEASGRQSYFLLTGPGYQGKTAENLERGASLAGIEEAYGKAKRALETPAGQVLVYDELLMILGREGKLERWVLWGEKRQGR